MTIVYTTWKPLILLKSASLFLTTSRVAVIKIISDHFDNFDINNLHLLFEQNLLLIKGFIDCINEFEEFQMKQNKINLDEYPFTRASKNCT